LDRNKAKENGHFIIHIGDGHSDRCAAKEADLVFAKGSLSEFCKSEQIRFLEYDNFSEIVEVLKVI
jgi:2-hydroxy-3-keto-5-methylthiopentenyl-1-phosphate phosphatase